MARVFLVDSPRIRRQLLSFFESEIEFEGLRRSSQPTERNRPSRELNPDLIIFNFRCQG